MTHQIEIEGADVTFACEQGETVLDAAERQGIELPYACRKGVCGNCCGQVLAGQLVPGTAGGSAEAGIHSPDEHLFCRAQAASDLLIRPRHWQRLDPNARKKLSAKVFRITRSAPDVTVLQLRFASGVRVKFKAGQFLQVVLPGGQRRSYSMANAPHENDGVQLHIRHVDGGLFSEGILSTLKAGDTLQVELPHGDFWLREDSERPLLLVAGGTGFAPIKSILDHMVRRKLHRPVTLYWGSRTPAGLYASDTVARWQQQLPGLQYIPVVSRPAPEDQWAGRIGRLPAAVAQDARRLESYEVYACGAPAMIVALRKVCTDDLGLPGDRFFSDAFVSAAS